MEKRMTEIKSDAQNSARRKKNNIHKVLTVVLWLLVLLPLVLCIILFMRVGTLEKELKEVRELTAQAEPGSFSDRLKEMALAEAQEEFLNQGQEADGTQADGEELSSASSSSIETGNFSKEDISRQVYLTFDDGPSSYTGQVLDILKENGTTATFFCIGRTDEASREIYRRIVDEGHTLAMHSFTHDYEEIYESLESFKADFYKIQNHLETITGVKPVYYRFPGGSSNTVSTVNMMECIHFLNGEGIRYFDWNALNGDAEGKSYTLKQMLRRTMQGVKKQETSVVLMHDNKKSTVQMLPKLLKKLKKQGAVIKAIDENTPLVQHKTEK